MARKRMIDPEFWLDEEVASLSPMARLLYIGLWGICDDNYATLPNKPVWIKAQIFPYDSANTQRLLNELSSVGKIVAFLGPDGKEYWFIKNFFKYQRVDKPSKPKYPAFTKETQLIGTTLQEYSGSTPAEVKLSKDKLREIQTPSSQGDDLFEGFWKEYPKKVGKGAALKSWRKLKPSQDMAARIRAAVIQQRGQEQWTKDGGQYIPYPATWLNQGRWDDEVQVEQGRVSDFTSLAKN